MPTISNAAPIQGSYIADKKAQIKGALELGNVDNTRDIDKPVSAAMQAALNAKLPAVSLLVEGLETVAPAAPASKGYRLYAEDNGSGKTRLMVKFATGPAQQVAIEP